MIICCIGDSLTEGDYGIKGVTGVANVHEKNYPYFLQKMTGAEVRNFGKCGWRSSDMLAWYLEGGLDLTGADKIVLMLGTNGGQSPEGTSAEDEAYRQLVSGLRKEVPEAELYLCTPPHVTEDPTMSNCGYAPQVQNAVAFVKKTAAETGLKLIDLAEDPHFTAETEWEMQPNDGLHFTETGYRTLARDIYDAIFYEG